MGPYAAIYSRLTAAQTGDVTAQTDALAVLTAAMGTPPRVYPGVSDQNAYPLITYESHQENEDSLTPMVGKEFTVTITITCQGTAAYVQAHTIKTATRTLLDRKTSPAGGWGGINAKCYLQGSDESSEADGGNADALFYEITEEYRVWAQA